MIWFLQPVFKFPELQVPFLPIPVRRLDIDINVIIRRMLCVLKWIQTAVFNKIVPFR